VPQLTVLSGPDAGRTFPLNAPTLTVGRHSSNPIALHDNRVSRRHLELRQSSGGYQLFDLDSGNGTIVNGRTIRVIDLRPGDRIEIGDTVLRYESTADSSIVQDPEAGQPTEKLRLVVKPGGDELPSAIVQTVAAEAGSVMLRQPEAASTDWLRTRLASLAVMYEAANAVSEILDVDELLGRVMDLVLRTTEADHGCFLVRDPETGVLLPKAVRARPSSASRSGEFVVSRTVTDYVLRERQGILITDAGADERFRDGASIARHGLHEIICVPMQGRHETVGVLFLSSLQHGSPPPTSSATAPAKTLRLTDEHLHLAVAIAHQAALAVEETRYYQAMLQAERLAAIGQTIAALSHHIKNIMQGVRFGGDMVRMALANDDRELLVKGWRLVEKNQAKIDDLILDMLSYSKEREPAKELTNLNDITEDVLEVVRGRAVEIGVTLDWHPGEIPLVPCDPDGIHRAILNIVSNALDALEGREGGVIHLQSQFLPGLNSVELRISDNGPGIPPDKLNDIFKPFVSTKGARGTGLGLPVSRKTVREHGGDLLVDTPTGGGAIFVLRLPIREIATTGTVSRSDAEPVTRPLN